MHSLLGDDERTNDVVAVVAVVDISSSCGKNS